MGMVIALPQRRALPPRRDRADAQACGEVVILPVVRIERFSEPPASGSDNDAPRAGARRRRRRASRP